MLQWLMEHEVLQNVIKGLNSHYEKLKQHAAPDNIAKELDKIFKPDIRHLDSVSQKEIKNILYTEHAIAEAAVYNYFDNNKNIQGTSAVIHSNQVTRLERQASVLQEGTEIYPEIKTLKDAYKKISEELQEGQTNPLKALDHRKFPGLSEKDRETILTEKETQNMALYNSGAVKTAKITMVSGKNNEITKVIEDSSEVIHPVPRDTKGNIDGVKWNESVIERLDKKIENIEKAEIKKGQKQGMVDHDELKDSLKEGFSDLAYKGELASAKTVQPGANRDGAASRTNHLG